MALTLEPPPPARLLEAAKDVPVAERVVRALAQAHLGSRAALDALAARIGDLETGDVVRVLERLALLGERDARDLFLAWRRSKEVPLYLQLSAASVLRRLEDAAVWPLARTLLERRGVPGEVLGRILELSAPVTSASLPVFLAGADHFDPATRLAALRALQAARGGAESHALVRAWQDVRDARRLDVRIRRSARRRLAAAGVSLPEIGAAVIPPSGLNVTTVPPPFGVLAQRIPLALRIRVENPGPRLRLEFVTGWQGDGATLVAGSSYAQDLPAGTSSLVLPLPLLRQPTPARARIGLRLPSGKIRWFDSSPTPR